jgi:ribonucleoside-diphosphate reductase alpha chain
LGRTDLVHVLDKPEVLNTGADDWDDIPTSLEYEKAPELSSVRVVGTLAMEFNRKSAEVSC